MIIVMCLQAFDLLACHVYARTVVRDGAEGKRVGDGVKKRGVKIMARVYQHGYTVVIEQKKEIE